MSTLSDPAYNYVPEEEPKPDPLAILRAAQAYVDAEEARLNGPSPSHADPTVPDLSPFRCFPRR